MLILKTFGGIVQYYVGDPFQDAKKDKKKPTSAKKGDEKDKSKDKGRTAFLPNFHLRLSNERFNETFSDEEISSIIWN